MIQVIFKKDNHNYNPEVILGIFLINYFGFNLVVKLLRTKIAASYILYLLYFLPSLLIKNEFNYYAKQERIK